MRFFPLTLPWSDDGDAEDDGDDVDDDLKDVDGDRDGVDDDGVDDQRLLLHLFCDQRCFSFVSSDTVT